VNSYPGGDVVGTAYLTHRLRARHSLFIKRFPGKLITAVDLLAPPPEKLRLQTWSEAQKLCF
jgi:hypothetical protein